MENRYPTPEHRDLPRAEKLEEIRGYLEYSQLVAGFVWPIAADLDRGVLTRDAIVSCHHKIEGAILEKLCQMRGISRRECKELLDSAETI